LASRSTRTRIDRSVRGRPGRLGRETLAWRRATRSRCQRRAVSGRTSNRSPLTRLWVAGGAAPPVTPDHWGRTGASDGPAGVAAPRSGGVERGSRRPCPDRSSAAVAGARTHSSHRGTPVVAARRASSRRERGRRVGGRFELVKCLVPALSRADDIFGKHRVAISREAEADVDSHQCVARQRGPPKLTT
jgi:hypothetical protein